MEKQTGIQFHPFFNNILDHVGKEWTDGKGNTVKLQRNGVNFVVVVNEEIVLESDDNLFVSARLSERELRVAEKAKHDE